MMGMVNKMKTAAATRIVNGDFSKKDAFLRVDEAHLSEAEQSAIILERAKAHLVKMGVTA
jgi:hypothetical protein